MNVALLNIEQKETLEGHMYAPDSYFNPVQDIDDNWVISTQEQEFCVVEAYMWVKDLPLIEWKPKPYDPPIIPEPE